MYPDYLCNGEYWCVFLARHFLIKGRVMNLVVGGLNDTAIQHIQPVKISFMARGMKLDLLLYLSVPNISNGQHYYLS